MSNEEILKLAIEKAYRAINVKVNFSELLQVSWTVRGVTYSKYSVKELIFSHDFAKAFWSKGHHKEHDDVLDCKCGNNDEKYCSKFHLQEMVLEEDPIKYLAQFLAR